jgi:aminoglycoside 6-adenylyltransferase
MLPAGADHERRYESLIEGFVAWASNRQDIYAAVVVGSRARADHPADQWSDLDVVTFATDPPALLADESWVFSIGEPAISFIEPTAVDDMWQERRVLFANGCDADFSILPADLIAKLEHAQPGHYLHEQVAPVVRRGYRVLVDKGGRLAPSLARMAALPPAPPAPPTQVQLDATLSDFWYHAVWTARKVRRGELVVAHECLEGTQRHLLMRLIRWLAERDGTVWHGARFMEEWMPAAARQHVAATWALHDRVDILRALAVMMDLVSSSATEIGDTYGLRVDRSAEDAARHWVTAAIASRSGG